jgi:hypothetical protein
MLYQMTRLLLSCSKSPVYPDSIGLGEITNMEPDKCDRLAWFAVDDLPENVIPYVRRAFDNYRRGKWFDSFGW